MVAEYPQFRLRLRPDLYEWIEEKAKANHRTKNAEMNFRIEQARKSEEMTVGRPAQE